MATSPKSNSAARVGGWSVVAVFVLLGAALLATVITTRASVTDATSAVGRGQAIEVEQAVQIALGDLDNPDATDADLAGILAANADDGLRYIARVEGRGARVAARAGTEVAPGAPPAEITRARSALDSIDGRFRLSVRTARRRDGGGNRMARYIIEVEPVQAHELRATANLTLWIGGFASLGMLGVAFVLSRREARRAREERAKEHARRLASLGEMSAVLAHEIKNPLASLKGNAQLLASMLPEGEKPRAKAQRVVDEAVRLEKLTTDLLTFVRTGELARAPIDPAALARDAAAAVSPAIAVDTARAPATFALDAARIREVLVNLCDNARAAGEPIAVVVEATAKRALVITVRDHGPGVPAEDRDHIFDAFVTNKTNGTGLGLAVARRTIELHGGTITVSDADGGGALFRVEIPWPAS